MEEYLPGVPRQKYFVGQRVLFTLRWDPALRNCPDDYVESPGYVKGVSIRFAMSPDKATLRYTVRCDHRVVREWEWGTEGESILPLEQKVEE